MSGVASVMVDTANAAVSNAALITASGTKTMCGSRLYPPTGTLMVRARWRMPGKGNRSKHGHRQIRVAISAHVLCAGRADRVSRRGRRAHNADRHLSGDPHPGRHGDLELHRAEHAGDGAA